MILIYSKESDSSTNHVIDWLHFYKKEFFRLNQENRLIVNKILLSNSNNEVIIGGKKWHRFTKKWFWRGGIMVNHPPLEISNISFKEDLIDQLSDEITYSARYIYSNIVPVKNTVGNYEEAIYLNKLETLKCAVKLGIKIPATLITSCKKELKDFKLKYKEIISKAISDVRILDCEGQGHLYTYTTVVGSLKDIPNKFFPSLFQENIKKKIEIRVFFIDQEYYAMAIFSQKDDKTKVDFRNYNFSHKNRMVPYRLPRFVKKKLKKLMKMINLTTGSIDLILDDNNKYIFLEVNPVGQYGMVSQPCNYILHKIIAKKIIN